MSDSYSDDRARDESLARSIAEHLSALQMAIHEAIEAGLKVDVTVEQMNPMGEHYPEPLLEVGVERIVKLC